MMYVDGLTIWRFMQTHNKCFFLFFNKWKMDAGNFHGISIEPNNLGNR